MENNSSSPCRYRLVILRNITIELIRPALKQKARDNSIILDIEIGGLSTAVQESLNGRFVETYRDLYVLCLCKFVSLQGICERFCQLSDDDIISEKEHALNTVTSILNNISRYQPNSLIAVHNFELFSYPETRFSDNHLLKDQNDVIAAFNSSLASVISTYPLARIIDTDLVLRRIGSNHFYDMRYWYYARSPFTLNALNSFAELYINELKLRDGKIKKCLVLDCDNTLWGGIIGEDGLSGIVLGDMGKGNAYVAFQQYIINLAHNGIILALCSKNNEEDVWQVFDEHPSMILKKEHIAAHRINWNSKDQNLLEIALELNIGLDSIVFVDDSDFEINLVASSLPLIKTIHLDANNPSSFIKQIQESQSFVRKEIILEDQERNRSYQDNKLRSELRSQMSLNDYLTSLRTEALIRSANSNDIKRIAQMSQKTNQFNLTSERITEQEVQLRLNSEARKFILLQVRDRFGDLGVVGYTELNLQDRDKILILNLALSCRVLGRNLEHLFLQTVVKHLVYINDNATIFAEFISSGKNSQVIDFYDKHGFEALEIRYDRTVYALSIQQYMHADCYDYINLTTNL